MAENIPCAQCGAAPERVAKEFPFHELPGVFLCGLDLLYCPGCRQLCGQVPHLEGLRRFLAVRTALRAGPLCPQEFALLRAYLGFMSFRALAELCDIPATSTWEWEKPEALTSGLAQKKFGELLLRTSVLAKHGRYVPLQELHELHLKPRVEEVLRLRFQDGHWGFAPA